MLSNSCSSRPPAASLSLRSTFFSERSSSNFARSIKRTWSTRSGGGPSTSPPLLRSSKSLSATATPVISSRSPASPVNTRRRWARPSSRFNASVRKRDAFAVSVTAGQRTHFATTTSATPPPLSSSN